MVPALLAGCVQSLPFSALQAPGPRGATHGPKNNGEGIVDYRKLPVAPGNLKCMAEYVYLPVHARGPNAR